MRQLGDALHPDRGPGAGQLDQLDRALLVTSLRRRGMTGIHTHLVEAERVLGERFRHVDTVSLDTLHPVGAGLVLATHLLGRVPLSASQLSRWWLVERALQLSVARQVNRNRPDVVYAQDVRSAGAALAARGEARYAVVMVVHCNESETSELVGLGVVQPGTVAHRELEGYESEVLRRLDGIVFVSDFMRRQVFTRVPEVAALPHAIIPNALGRITGPPSSPTLTGDCITVGMLVGRKNHVYLLDVVAAARARGRDIRLTVVGDGSERRVLVDHAQRVGVADLVTFTGRRDDVDTLLRGHRVYVHSALLENAPYAIIEALRAGLPVVTSDVGGIPEVVGGSRAGRYWSLDDPEAGAGVLAALLDDPTDLHHSATAAARRFAEVYDEAVAGRWLGDFLTGAITHRELATATAEAA